MSHGVANKEEELAIGFLKDVSSDKKTQLYLDTFDAVITHDGPFDFINELLREIIG
mgnify:CR=1 FL=1